jgi:Sulfotransferase domain
MLRAIAKAVVHSLGLRPPGRDVEVFADDMFVVSYPKSGNSWVRFLIANLVAQGRPVDFSSVQEIVPGIDWLSASKLGSLSRPRILKSHEYFDPRYPKVLYLVRDPRDVVVSYYHHHLRGRLIPEGYPIEEYVARFLAGRLDPYGSWNEHVGSWLGARERDPGFLLVRYEDLSAAPQQGLRRVADFLGLRPSEAALDLACERSSFEAMRRLERFQAETAGTLSPVRVQQPFVRSGTVGGWRRELPPALAARITARWGTAMAALGYGEPTATPERAEETAS